MVNKKRGIFFVVLALVLAFSVNAQTGCDIDPASSTFCTSITIDNPIPGKFIAGAACDTVDECEEVRCDHADTAVLQCQVMELEKCKFLGKQKNGIEGKAVTQESLCTVQGCCEVSKGDSCTVVQTTKIGCNYIGISGAKFTKMVGGKCGTCSGDLKKVSIAFKVVDKDGAVQDVSVTPIGGTAVKTDSKGEVVFKDLLANADAPYVFSVSKSGYVDQSISVKTADKDIEKDVKLVKIEGVLDLTVKVLDLQNKPVTATISLKGTQSPSPKEGSTVKFDQLPAGKYDITASAAGYESQKKTETFQKDTTPTVTFQLKPTSKVGVTVKTVRDNQPQPGAEIFLNGKFHTISQYPNGDKFIPLIVTKDGQKFTISAKYKEYASDPLTFTINKGQQLTKTLILKKTKGECTIDGTNPTKKVAKLDGKAAKGKEEVELTWTKPCPEVDGYKLIKEYKKGDKDVKEEFTLPLAQTKFSDSDVEWGETYKYSIKVIYTDGKKDGTTGTRISEETSVDVTLGAEACAGLSVGTQFCDPKEPNKIKICGSKQEIIAGATCQSGFYCSPSGKGVACKSDAQCKKNNGLFSLFSTKEKCYGSFTGGKPANFCVYQPTKSIVNSCKSCADKEKPIKSCYDYTSEDACKVNSCLTEKCNWVKPGQADDAVISDFGSIYQGYDEKSMFALPDFGKGFCVPEKKYEAKDKCGLCSNDEKIFNNFFCTADICTGLGSCYSQYNLNECKTCSDIPTSKNNCAQYKTKQECTGGNDKSGVSKNTFEVIAGSEDNCAWNRCGWDTDSLKCFKDGNANKKSDCSELNDESGNCRIDITPPVAKLLTKDLSIISLGEPKVQIEVDDTHAVNKKTPQNLHSQRNKIKELKYCLTPAVGTDTCTSDKYTTFSFDNTFLFKGTADIDIAKHFTKPIPGILYKLKFFALDKYLNQGDVQESLLFIDTTIPDFKINTQENVIGDKVQLTAYLSDLSEPASCKFSIKPIIAQDTHTPIVAARKDNVKQAKFTLSGVHYELIVECVDDFGNKQEKKKSLVFNLDQKIQIIAPKMKQVLSKTSLQFEVRTTVAADCVLQQVKPTAQQKAIFNKQDGTTSKHHKTAFIHGFTQGEYAAAYKAVCTEQLNPNAKKVEAHFHFIIDFLSPNTKITLEEGSRKVTPIKYGWEEIFVNEAEVTLACDAGSTGYQCDKIKYCLGKGCSNPKDTKYQDYSSTFSVKKSTPICYYSTDKGGSKFPIVYCGDILVNGFGITMEKPEPQLIDGEVWGFSSKPKFDWQLITLVPSLECAFDFKKGFDFKKVSAKQKLTKDKGKYLFKQFPGTLPAFDSKGSVKEVFVKCNNAGEISPEQKFFLEFDPTPPKILEAKATPKSLIEGNSVQLMIKTDDRSICKFSDTSNSKSSAEFQAMKFSFAKDKAGKPIFGKEHKIPFAISFKGKKKNFRLTTQCQNGAGLLSKQKDILFSVDYTVAGNIEKISHEGGYVKDKKTTLKVNTNKNANCEYTIDGKTKKFDKTGGTEHSTVIDSSKEGKYTIPVKCTMGKQVANGKAGFEVDRTAPKVNKIDDGLYTCGAENLSVMVYTQEKKIANYEYEIYDHGETKKIGVKKVSGIDYPKLIASPKLVQTKKVGKNTPLKINIRSLFPGKNLSDFFNHTLHVKVRASDEADNIGKYNKSDGFFLVNSTHPACVKDTSAPILTVNPVEIKSCEERAVKITCEDEVGCKEIAYGISVKPTCNATAQYNGKNILFNTTSYLCYQANDTVNNKATGKDLIKVPDEDGDGILDSCDKCPKTKAGKIADGQGCTAGQTALNETTGKTNLTAAQKKIDSDSDTLPDAWEDYYDSLSCELDSKKADSDGNGILDGAEDYDNDGASNYQEYLSDTDPCVEDDDFLFDDTKKLPGATPVTDDKADKPTTPTLPGETKKETDYLPLILFIIGLLMVLGGTGYLIYYYKYKQPEPTTAKPSFKPKIAEPLPEKISPALRGRRKKLRERARESIFGLFSKKSDTIPHVESALDSRKTPHGKIKAAADSYVKHKGLIKPGLKSHEKSIFDKLESLSKKSKNKSINSVIDKGEAENLFAKLKKITEKRKK